MEENARADKIISQATQWSFEGDCSLLAWMQELSQLIEQRATKTSDALQKLNVNVNRTAIALDNAANSLTALQYTQFVESRCHDDDETQTNTIEVGAETAATSAKMKSPKEVLETFLQKNLQMLQNCHEKYALDFEDSDEDEGTNTNNYIYQAKNPYNDALLPHIYGSKLWKEHWHVGLCDGSNEYSGDEASDAFSETSSSSAADNESYESNTANLSEWASSSSIPIEHKHPALMVTQKDHASHASATAPARNKHLPSTQHLPSNDDSDTYSTTSRSTTTNPPIIAREHDLFAALRHDTPITSTSTSSSPQQHIAVPAQPQRVLAPKSSTIAPFFDVTPPTDIFADADTVQQTTNSVVNEAVQRKAAGGQIKRKPVNLFDDDDFNSFMTEVVDKAQTKVAQEQQEPPVPASRSLPSRSEANLPPKKTMDLFAEPASLKKPTMTPATAPIAIEKPKVATVRKPVNLFDSPEGSPEKVFASNKASDNNAKDFAPTFAKPIITAKSLFDDDDDDDDFLNVFGAKKLNLPQRATSKTLLFDDENEENQRQPANTRTTVNLFDDTPPDDDFTQTTEVFKENNNNKKPSDSLTINGTVSSNALQQSKTTAKVEPVVTPNTTTGTTTTTTPEAALNPQLPQTPAVKAVSKLFGANLFADDDNDDLDDLFHKSSAKEKPPKIVDNEPSDNVPENVATPKPIINAIKPQKNSLFGDDLAEDDNDDLFGSNRRKDGYAAAPGKASRILKSSSLFGDDFDDEADDLFGVKPAKKLIASTVVSKNEPEIASVTPTVKEVLAEQEDDKSSIKHAPKTEVFEAKKSNSPQKSLFEDEDLEDPNDLFRTTKRDTLSGEPKRAEESNDILNAVEAGLRAAEPTPLAIAAENQSADLKQTSVNGLFGATIESVSEKVTEKTQKITTSDVTTEEIIGNAKNNIENIKSSVPQAKNAFVNTLTCSEKSTPNENEIKEIRMLSEHNKNSIESQLASSLDHTVDQPEILETPQPTLEPIETSVDVVNPAADTNKQTEPHQENTTSQQKYTSIFLEEPPDDDDFFATLSNNTKPLSVSKLTLDLENDFYEPALPQVPSSARTTTTAATTSTLAGSSDYGGLRLFSEIPPDDDDDGEDFNAAKQSSKQAADNGIGVNQRLHSVFYDDFTETLEAVQQIKENKIAAHALFDDEPPPDEELFAVGPAETPKYAAETATPAITTTKAEKGEGVQEKVEHLANATSGAEHSKDVTDRAIPRQEDTTIASPAERPRAAAGKLQIPNININVQALLPGGSGRPSFKKSSTTPVVPTATQTPIEVSVPSPAAELRKPTSSASLKSTASAASANESLLPSVCKTRVRAPAGRRPSTRRARQANYLQSLSAEQNEHIVAEAPTSSSSITRKPRNQNEIESWNAQPTSSSVATAPIGNVGVKLTKSANSFLDEAVDVDDDDILFKPAHTNNNTNAAFGIKTSRDLNEQVLCPQVNFARETPKSIPNKVDVSESDGDDDLFKSVRVASTSAAPKPANNSNVAIITTPTPTPTPTPTTTTTTTTQSVPPTRSATQAFFGNTPSEDSDDDLFKSNKSLLDTATQTKTKVANTPTTMKTAAAPASRAAEAAKTTTERKLDSIFGSDDEDDDFLSQLKPKSKAMASLLSASAGGAPKPTSTSSAGLFSDVESDEDDLFGARSQTKTITGKAKAVTTTTTSTNHKQKPIATKPQSLDKQTTLSDNPLADLLNP